jgi:multidrug efflux pump subunit AcrB
VFVSSASGARIPLSQVVEVSFAEDEYDIEHNLFQPQIEIDVTASPGKSVAALTAEVKSVVESFELPAGFTISYAGKIADQADSFGGMTKYAGIVGLIVLAILVFQFGSIIQPIIICAAIPLSFIGAFLLLYILDQPISFLAFIGLTSLMGIVINNSILLVDEGNQLRQMEPSQPISEIAIKAGMNRFMPIVLTSITSIAGLLPLAVGDTMFKALAIAVIGGLFTSMFLTLICVPVLYAYFTRSDSEANRVTQHWTGNSELGQHTDE